jgi:REP element-mobilizing transposase RayT
MNWIRDFEKGDFLHVYNRGNHRNNIAYDEEDKSMYVYILYDSISEYEQELLAYCIMDNHYHFQVKVRDKEWFIRMMQSLGIRYSAYFNKKYNKVGRLFQSRYTHITIKNNFQLLNLSGYIHRNPKDVKGIESIKDLINYPWSSFNEYVNWDKIDRLLKQSYILNSFDSGDDYLKFVITEDLKEHLSLVKDPFYYSEAERNYFDKVKSQFEKNRSDPRGSDLRRTDHFTI